MEQPKQNSKIIPLIVTVPIIILAAFLFIQVFSPLHVASIELTQKMPIAGEPLPVSVLLENKGLFSKTGNVTVYIDGAEAHTESFSIEAGRSQTVEITVPAQSAGLHTIRAGQYSTEIKFLRQAAFQVTWLQVNSHFVVAQNPFDVTVRIKNDGEVAGAYSARFINNGEVVKTEQVQIGPGKTKEFTTQIVLQNAGEQSLELDEKIQGILVHRAALVEIVGLELSKEKARTGEVVMAKVKLMNSGEVMGDFYEPIFVNGEALNSKNKNVIAGDTVLDVLYKIPHSKAGTYEIEIGSFKKTLIAYDAAADCRVTEIKFSSQFPKKNQSVNAAVTVTNHGDLPGKIMVTLKIDGKATKSKLVHMKGNSTQVLNFTVKQAKTGYYTVSAGAVKKTLYVGIVTRPANNTFFVKTFKKGYNSCGLFNDSKVYDAIFILVNKNNRKKVVVSVYARANNSAHIDMINGDYVVYVIMGKNYDTKTKRFINTVLCGRIDGFLNFDSNGSEDAYIYYYTIDTCSVSDYSLIKDDYRYIEPIREKDIPR